MKFLNNPITSLHDVELFVDHLGSNDKLFHFDDDPIDVIDINGEPIFTPYECGLVNLRINEICELNLLDEAFNYTLTKHLNK